MSHDTKYNIYKILDKGRPNKHKHLQIFIKITSIHWHFSMGGNLYKYICISQVLTPTKWTY